MENLTLNIQKYAALQEEKARIEAEMAELKGAIVEDMNASGVDAFATEDGLIAKVIESTKFKYTNEKMLIDWCKQNNRFDLISENIVTTKFNKELKGALSLNESLGSGYAKSTTITLKVENYK
jgi:hypothetical protein